MTNRRVLTCAFSVLSVVALQPAQVRTQVQIARLETEPEVFSIAPLGTRQGSTVEVEIRGRTLEEAYGAWFDVSGLKAQVKKIEEIELEEKKEYGSEAGKQKRGARVRLEVTVEPTAPVGMHSLRLVTPYGISNALAFLVGSEPITAETEKLHDTPDLAQPLSLPVVVHGKISQPGDVDYYSFEVLQGQELLFEVFAKPAVSTLAGPRGFDAQLAIYQPTASWFDAAQVTRLAFNDEPVSKEHRQSNEFVSTNPRLHYRFIKAGRYLVQVASFLGYGGPDCPYQLRVAPPEKASLLKGEESLPQLSASGWRERDYDRKLEPNRLQLISSRAVMKAERRDERTTTEASTSSSGPSSRGRPSPNLAGLDPAARNTLMVRVEEKEPNETAGQALAVSVPTLIDGKIDHAGDIDQFSFKAEPGQALAFEIEAPQEGPPVFNPWLRVVDEEGREVFTNLYKRIGRAFTFYNKTVEPKTTYTFELGGRYSLQVRDFSSRNGSSDFVYRILIRPQISHVGEIEVCWECSKKLGNLEQKTPVDRINLTVGEAKRFIVVAELEEGFTGNLAVTVEGLPRGVDVSSGTEAEPGPSAPIDEGDKERFMPKRSMTTVLLLAAADAPQTLVPQLIRITARPVVDGKVGLPLPVRAIPLMIVRPRQPGAHGSR